MADVAVRRFLEITDFGVPTDRVAYATYRNFLPPPKVGAQWKFDRLFNADIELARSSGFGEVMTAARRSGATVVHRG